VDFHDTEGAGAAAVALSVLVGTGALVTPFHEVESLFHVSEDSFTGTGEAFSSTSMDCSAEDVVGWKKIERGPACFGPPEMVTSVIWCE